ncbi:MAG TPA: hypothetical protein VF817_04725 [Patescibacteria group bacterium]
MKNSSNIIIASLVALFVLSAAFLAYTETKQSNPDYSRNLWMTYFNDPKSQDLSFTIENHSASSSFRWEVFADKVSVAKGDANVKLDEKKSISLSINDTAGKKILIKITAENSSKEIYKNL